MLAVSRSLRTAQQQYVSTVFRGTSYNSRSFHRSAVAFRIPEDPTVSEKANDEQTGCEKDNTFPRVLGERTSVKAQGEKEDTRDGEAESTPSIRGGRTREGYGSAARRAGRHKRVKEVPPVILPSWFYEKNIRLFDASKKKTHVDLEDAPRRESVTLAVEESQGAVAAIEFAPEKDQTEILEEMTGGGDDTGGAESVVTSSEQPEELSTVTDLGEGHKIDSRLYKELLFMMRATLFTKPPSTIDFKDLIRRDVVLKCPKTEGTRFLDLTIESLAKDLEVDVIRLDAEDIAHTVGGYVGDNIAWNASKIGLLGYAAHLDSGKMEDFHDEVEESIEDGPNDAADDDNESAESPLIGSKSRWQISGTPKKTQAGGGRYKPAVDLLDTLLGVSSGSKPSAYFMGEVSTGSSNSTMPLSDFIEASANSGNYSQPSTSETWADFKLTAVLETLVDARKKESHEKEMTSEDLDKETTSAAETEETGSRGLIIHIAEYAELKRKADGRTILKKLNDIVKRRWVDGKDIVIVGTSVAELDFSSRGAIRHAQGSHLAENRTIFVPPARTTTLDSLLVKDERRYITNINIRHLGVMLEKLRPDTEQSINIEPYLVECSEDSPMCNSILRDSTIYRIAMLMLGSSSSTKSFTDEDLQKALEILASSDAYKFNWAAKERQSGKETEDTSTDITEPPLSAEHQAIHDKTVAQLAGLYKDANKYEKRLIGGIVHAFAIRTSYKDVRAPATTIEALKSLTSLSLQRPDAFKYGILSSERIPGVLLYGPPGTGKTLLAKAVAKESGATVLEVSGSEIYDMYVGEGEKNVKAVFTLAKKLSPCVIFIDEADAMFGARGGGDTRRTSHRELINQFLKELDGLRGFEGILMVATNRPFDLDDAVLRRLPRRILVDLPREEDREAILGLQLVSETLDESVNLAQLAKNTPFYSGSDLKNLAVAAALACVREENEVARRHAGIEAYEYPEKRTLRKEHFDKAMEEISASISEDMSTLAAIRKFDERYGDRKGRRKKSANMGFGGIEGGEQEDDGGRVRTKEIGR